MLTAYKGETYLLSVTALDLEEKPKTNIATANVSVFSYTPTSDRIDYLPVATMQIGLEDGLCVYRWSVPETPMYDDAIVHYEITDNDGFTSSIFEPIKFLEQAVLTGSASSLTPTEHEWLRVAFEKTHFLQYDEHWHVKSAEQHPVFTEQDRDKLDNMADRLEYLINLEGGRWKIDRHTGQIMFYAENNITEIARFALKDKFGNPVVEAGQAFERVKL